MSTGTPAVEPQEVDEAIAALEGSEGKMAEEIKAEEKTEEEKAAEAAEVEQAERTKPHEIEENGVTRTETEAEVEARIKAEDAAKEELSEMDLLKDEVKDLRQLLRTAKREQTQTQAKLERLGKRSVAAGESEEELDEDGKPIPKKEEPLSHVEELQQGITQIGAERGAQLDILLETMEQNEKYKDVREVCSRANFDDIFEMIAAQIVADKGGDLDEVLLEIEFNTWSRTNPYSYMYDVITKYHPDYAKKEGVAAPGGDKGKKKEPVKAPGSIGGLGGDGALQAGWTKKRIDDLPEDELDAVPKEIYDKYMRDQLE